MIDYLIHLGIYLIIFGCLSVSLNIIVGYCGYLSLAHAAFFAVGCYSYALFSTVWRGNLALSFFAATIAGAALSLTLSICTWRLKGDFFVMISLAVQAIVTGGLRNWFSAGRPLGSWSNLTNGPSGIPGIPRPAIAGIEFDTTWRMFALTSGVLGLVIFAISWVIKGPYGRILKAMKDDDLAMRSLGKDTRWLRVKAFAMSGAAAAIAGVIYSSYVGYVDPTVASLDSSVLILSMVIVGGSGTVTGPLKGTALLLLAPELLRFLNISDQKAASLRLLAYGLLLVVMTNARPQSLDGVDKAQT